MNKIQQIVLKIFNAAVNIIDLLGFILVGLIIGALWLIVVASLLTKGVIGCIIVCVVTIIVALIAIKIAFEL